MSYQTILYQISDRILTITLNRPEQMNAFTVVIQAGGQSSRMGEDKALKLFLGRPLIERVIENLLPIADEMIVTTNRPAEYGFVKHWHHRPPKDLIARAWNALAQTD